MNTIRKNTYLSVLVDTFSRSKHVLYDGHHVRSNYYIASKGHGCQFCSRSDEPGKRFENFYGAIIAIAQDK